MSRPLLEYHSLEDGELNRLWYEENDPRARDAFRIRWWLGGDPIAGKDLFAEYHNLIYHRCLERGVLTEDEHERVHRATVDRVVAEFPADPIAKFEDFLLPFVDRAIDELEKDREGAPPKDDAAAREAVDGVLGDGSDASRLVRAWIAGEPLEADDAGFDAALDKLKDVVRALDGDAVAARHPLICVEKPPPSKLDPSVALPHFEGRQILTWAADPTAMSKREHQHLEWRRACRERCVGARLVLRRLRALHGGEVPPWPDVQPELDDALQKENPPVPQVEIRTGTSAPSGGGGKGVAAAVVIGVVLLVVVVVLVTR